MNGVILKINVIENMLGESVNRNEILNFLYDMQIMMIMR